MSSIAISTLVILSIGIVIFLTSVWKLNAFIALFLVSLFLALAVMPEKNVINIMKDGFGNTIASIGLLIILGTIIAVLLDKTGAAITIANYILSKTGESRAAVALGIAGFIAGLPIFCDSGFIILSGLSKSFSAKTKTAMPLIAGVLGCSLYSVHCLTPTHPGSLAAADILDVNIGNLILLGTLFAIPGFLVSYFWVKFMTKGKPYPPAEENKNSLEEERNHPSVALSFLPIVVPLFLITVGSLITIIHLNSSPLEKIFAFIGQPVIALLIGVVLAMLLLKDKKIKTVNGVFEAAIEKAGPILIVIAAGGMFGMIIKETGFGTIAGIALSKTGLGLVIPFGIAAILKTAQGSSTVAIITTASIIVSMLPSLGLDSESGKLFTMLAIGAGSMMLSHANDAYFWVITKFSDIHADVTLRVFSTATAIMGITVFACTWITSLFFL
jgi:GntP family gluconate:H+ symporter